MRKGNSMPGTVAVRLTNGFGNNLFQYIAARLLAEFLESDLVVIPPHQGYYGIDELKKLGVRFESKILNNPIQVGDSQ